MDEVTVHGVCVIGLILPVMAVLLAAVNAVEVLVVLFLIWRTEIGGPTAVPTPFVVPDSGCVVGITVSEIAVRVAVGLSCHCDVRRRINDGPVIDESNRRSNDTYHSAGDGGIAGELLLCRNTVRPACPQLTKEGLMEKSFRYNPVV